MADFETHIRRFGKLINLAEEMGAIQKEDIISLLLVTFPLSMNEIIYKLEDEVTEKGTGIVNYPYLIGKLRTWLKRQSEVPLQIPQVLW